MTWFIAIMLLSTLALSTVILLMFVFTRKLSRATQRGSTASTQITEAATKIEEITHELERDNKIRTEQIQRELDVILRGKRFR